MGFLILLRVPGYQDYIYIRAPGIAGFVKAHGYLDYFIKVIVIINHTTKTHMCDGSWSSGFFLEETS